MWLFSNILGWYITPIKHKDKSVLVDLLVKRFINIIIHPVHWFALKGILKNVQPGISKSDRNINIMQSPALCFQLFPNPHALYQ